MSLSRSFASKDRSTGESSFLRSRNTPHEGPRALVEPMVLHNRGVAQDSEASSGMRGFSGTQQPHTQPLPGNPLNIPLSRDLCDRVAEELARVTSYAIQIFQRVGVSPHGGTGWSRSWEVNDCAGDAAHCQGQPRVTLDCPARRSRWTWTCLRVTSPP